MTDFVFGPNNVIPEGGQRARAGIALETYFDAPNQAAKHAVVEKNPEIIGAVVTYNNLLQVSPIEKLPENQKVYVQNQIQENLVTELTLTGKVEFNIDNDVANELITDALEAETER